MDPVTTPPALPEDVARTAVEDATSVTLDVLFERASGLDRRAAAGAVGRFATARAFTLWFLCDLLVHRGVVDGGSIRADVPYEEIRFVANKRVRGGHVALSTLRSAVGSWVEALRATSTDRLSIPVTSRIRATLAIRQALGNDNLVTVECRFRTHPDGSPVKIDADAGLRPRSEIERRFVELALAFFRSRSAAAQAKVLKAFAERRYVAALVTCILGLGMIWYVIAHAPFHAVHRDASRQGQLLGAPPSDPPQFAFRETGADAGLVTAWQRSTGVELLYVPERAKPRKAPAVSNIEYEWHVRDSAGATREYVTNEPRLLFPTPNGLSIEGLFVRAREVVTARFDYRVTTEGKVQLLGTSGRPLTPPADAAYTADGYGVAVSPSDPDVQTVTVTHPQWPTLDANAIARGAGATQFRYDGKTDVPIVTAPNVTWVECLVGPPPAFKILGCESPTLQTHADDTIVGQHVGRRGTAFVFRGPPMIANRPLSFASWSVKNSETGAVESGPNDATFRWRPAVPGRYVISCLAFGQHVTKNFGKTPGQHQSYVTPVTAVYTVVRVF